VVIIDHHLITKEELGLAKQVIDSFNKALVPLPKIIMYARYEVYTLRS
jgi:hypothetical protein